MTTTSLSSAKQETNTPANTDTATFANGCFWCTEAIFEELDGVISATSGYTDGHVKILPISRFAQAKRAMQKVYK